MYTLGTLALSSWARGHVLRRGVVRETVPSATKQPLYLLLPFVNFLSRLFRTRAGREPDRSYVCRAEGSTEAFGSNAGLWPALSLTVWLWEGVQPLCLGLFICSVG